MLNRVFCGINRSNKAINALGRLGCKFAPSMSTMLMRTITSNINANESFLSGSSVVFMEELYKQWKAEPNSVDASWQTYFKNLDEGKDPKSSYQPITVMSQVSGGASGGGGSSPQLLRLYQLIQAYQNKGHLVADLDPLKLSKPANVPELDYHYYGFTDADLDQPIVLDQQVVKGGLLNNFPGGSCTLRQMINELKRCYASTVATEYTHIRRAEEIDWLRARIEAPKPTITKETSKYFLERLAYAVKFETFCQKHFSTHKRFGLEGAESLIPGLKCMIDKLTDMGCESLVIGMPHRGRLNVLGNVIRKPLQHIFQEFFEAYENSAYPTDPLKIEYYSSGDVKYHLGTTHDRKCPNGKTINLALLCNPSHLEAVDPLVMGSAKAKQFFQKDKDKSKVASVLIHGDAAFCGQGVVYESMQMAGVPNYGVGGTIHVIVNNQVGFTTDPVDGRSTVHCSDLGRGFDCPIFHVNSEDIPGVNNVFLMAAEYRQTFKRDVVIDLIGYRKHGHNEIDSPYFTQPTVYKVVDKKPNLLKIYEKNLLDQNLITKEECDVIEKEVDKVFQTAYDTRNEYKPKDEWLVSNWAKLKTPNQYSPIRETGMETDLLTELGKRIATVPEGFVLHKNVKKIYDNRMNMIKTGKDIDWGMAELMAYGSLMLEGNLVRISGQDCQRGTFSHRHCVLHDQNTNNTYIPLNHIGDTPYKGNYYKPAPFMPCNSILSENAVLGYEYGHSIEHPNQLCIWEGQFGDFSNGGQVMIDNIISSAESKWLSQSGLTLLLPHGHDGQGAEHSSCRIERYLSLCNDDPDDVPNMDESQTMQIQRSNWQVVNCTTPANFFHVIRRQLHRDFRKPLVVASPKFLLKYKLCASNLEEFGRGKRFLRILKDPLSHQLVKYDKVRKLIFCSGKIYYELNNYRLEKKIDDVAIVRIEQISPFPFDAVANQISSFPQAKIVWCQEEHKNMGCYNYVRPHLHTAARMINGKEIALTYAGRRAASAPATGYGKVHQVEQKHVIESAFA